MIVDPADPPRGLRDRLDWRGSKTVRYEPPMRKEEIPLHRTHPAVEGLAGYVRDTALDPVREGIVRRCGVIRTGAISTWNPTARCVPPPTSRGCNTAWNPNSRRMFWEFTCFCRFRGKRRGVDPHGFAE